LFGINHWHNEIFVFVFVFISLSIDPLQGQRPHGYRNSQVA